MFNLAQAPRNKESNDVVIPSFGKSRAAIKSDGTENCERKGTTAKKAEISSRKKVGEEKPRFEKAETSGTTFFPPAPLHDSSHRAQPQARVVGDEVSYSSRNGYSRRRGTGDDMSHSSSQERSPVRRREYSKRQGKDESYDTASMTELTVHMSSSFGGSSYAISIESDSVDEGHNNAETTTISTDDMVLLAQENEMIALAMERSMQEFSLNGSKHGSEDGRSVGSADGSIQSKHSECRSLRGVFRGKQRKSESRLMSVEEPSDSEGEDDNFNHEIGFYRGNVRDNLEEQRRLNGADSMAVLDLVRPAYSTMDDSNYSRYDSARGLDASRLSRFNDSHNRM